MSAWLLRLYRVGAFLAIVWLARGANGGTVRDPDSIPGSSFQTAPESDGVVGYSGPTNCRVEIDAQGLISGVSILESGDTVEHVRDVMADPKFLASFKGRSWEEVREGARVDGVAGATLTSLAIVEGMARRFGGTRPSCRFPQPVTVDEVRRFFPAATVLRTSPEADDIAGYSGPTDTLVALDPQGRVMGFAIRKSYDTPEYVDRIGEDAAFMRMFDGKDLKEVASMDAAVEGVSGATMTSQAVARGIVRAAGRGESARRPFPIRMRDVGLALLIVAALVVAFTPLRRNRKLRIALQIVLIAGLGFMSGDMISQALLAGWARSGIPWAVAPGLVLLTAAAILVPIFGGRQIYCHHLCPHGAAQELLRHLLPWKFALPRRLVRVLALIPALLLLVVVVVAMRRLPFDLAAIEPFDAYVWRVAGISAIAVAVVGLVVSIFVPMAYCRFGCPTGAVLQFLWLNGRSDRFGRRDLVALALVGTAFCLRLA